MFRFAAEHLNDVRIAAPKKRDHLHEGVHSSIRYVVNDLLKRVAQEDFFLAVQSAASDIDVTVWSGCTVCMAASEGQKNNIVAQMWLGPKKTIFFVAQ